MGHIFLSLLINQSQVPITIPADPMPPINPLYDVQTSNSPVFSFRVIRRATGTVLFDSSLGGLTLADQFNQIGFRLPNENLYGFGEHEHPSLKHNMSWITWGKEKDKFVTLSVTTQYAKQLQGLLSVDHIGKVFTQREE